MDTARERKPHDAVSGEGLGAGGKFRKRPFRRGAKTTSYNRPPTALRVRSRSTAFTAITGSSSLSVSTGAAPNFKFGCTVSSTSASPGVAATSGIESEAVKTRPYTGFGNLSNNPFVGTSAANASTGRSNFGFGVAVTSTANDQSQGSLFGAGSGSMLNSQASFSNSMPMHFSSTSSSQSFGLARNTAFSSGSSLFAASTSSAKLFNSGAAFGLSSSASSSEASTSSAIGGTTSSLFDSSWQSTKSNPIFGSAFNSTSSSAGLSSASTASVPATTSPSTGFFFTASTAAANATSPPSVFAFGAPAPSVAATSSSPGIFGSSIGESSGLAYSFTSGMAAPSSQPVFGNLYPGFAFASMPAVPAFNPNPVAPPQSSFVFASTPTSTANTFNFGAPQQNLGTVQNPFLATNSFGGSFSVVAGGAGRKIVKVTRKLRFGSSIRASSGPAYSFTSGMAAPSLQPVFGSLYPGFAFASMPAVPAFNPNPVAPPQSSFVFASTLTSTANTFNFGPPKQNLGTVQNPFLATNSFGGSFLVGAGGGDKSGRKIVKVSRKLRKK